MQEQSNMPTWRQELAKPKPSILRISDQEKLTFTFEDEGEKRTHPDYGDSIVFTVQIEGEENESLWYVNPKNFRLLNEINGLGHR